MGSRTGGRPRTFAHLCGVRCREAAGRVAWLRTRAGMEGPSTAAPASDWEVAEDPSLAMLDWMEYDPSTEMFVYPCERCGEQIELRRIDVDEGGGRCAECGGQLLLLDDDEFDEASPLPYDSGTINHTTLVVEGSLDLEVRVLPGMRIDWKFAEQDGQAVGFTATYAVHDRGFETRAPMTIVRNELRSELSSNFTMRAGGKLVMHFTNTAGDGSKRTEVVSGSTPRTGDLRELEPEPEPEPEPASGFSLDNDAAGGGSAYGALPPPVVIRKRAGAGVCNAACRINVAISRLPPFATSSGDMSGVIGTPGGSAGNGGTPASMIQPPNVRVMDGRGAGELELQEIPARHPQSGQTGAAVGFTIQEGTVLPSPSSASAGRSVQKNAEGGGSGGGLSESLLS